jgi:DNA-binding Lrp family transcriptional regulator
MYMSNMALDKLNKKIVQYMSNGTTSYQELARQCNVNRNTIYRRISTMQERGIIKNILHCTIDFEQIGITAITIGAKIPQFNIERAINILATNRNVRWLWRTYGDHNLTLVAFCSKGTEGETIQNVKGILEELDAVHICTAIGFVWEKMSYSPFEEQNEVEITPIVEPPTEQ